MSNETQPLLAESVPEELHADNNHTHSVYSENSDDSFFIQLVRSTFGFRKTTLTALVFATYLSIFLLSYYDKTAYNSAVPVPEPEMLSSSWLDLQEITKSYHPYASHDNDRVHDYILSRVQKAANSDFVSVSDDKQTKLRSLFKQRDVFNASSTDSRVIYYESSNILVKVQGSDPSLPGLLLSAHFDSVPTGHGSTDDGKGIASMLAILDHYATKQPKRTLVFNFNNNEEFGLLGATVFFDHKWSKLVSYVINLEGTGANGKAALFRTSDYGMAQYFASVRAPFGNSLYQQGFSNRYIHSETDYKVYVQNGLRGYDIAFYKPRNLYHTPKDSTQFDSRESLWHMLSNTLDLTETLANKVKTIDENTEPAVYFDILGSTFVVLSARTLYVWNIVLLIVFPVVAMILLIIITKKSSWRISFSWVRLPVSLFVSYLCARVISKLIMSVNPLVHSNDYFTPTLLVFSVFLLINYTVLTALEFVSPTQDFKTVAILEIALLLWCILLKSTVAMNQSNYTNTGEYAFTIVYVLFGVGALFGLLGLSFKQRSPIVVYSDVESEPQPSLLQRSFNYDWSIQFCVIVPISSFIIYTTLDLLLDAVNQTSQESYKSGADVFNFALLGSLFLSLPLLPFSHKFNYLFGLFLGIVFVVSTFKTVLTPAFTEQSPLKLRFIQSIDMANSKYSEVQVSGRSGYIQPLLEDLPSVKQLGLKVTCSQPNDGQQVCSYPGLKPTLVNNKKPLLQVKVAKDTSGDKNKSRYEPNSAELYIEAQENRACTLTFNATNYKSYSYGKSPLRMFTYFHNETTTAGSNIMGSTLDKHGNDVFRWTQGIDEVQLHKLDWSQKAYHIGLQWIPRSLDEDEDSGSINLGVHVTCFWGEFDNDVVIDGQSYRQVPAYDELLNYTPSSISWSNRNKGMVQVSTYVEL